MSTNRIIARKYFVGLVAISVISIVIAAISVLHAEHGHQHSKYESKEKKHGQRESHSTTQDAPASYNEGCGGCHMPYPSRLLPANSWERILGGLSNHFEMSVDLTAEQFNEIKSFLIAGAATGKMAREDALRITETSWFQHEHHKAQRRNNITNMSDCQSCHPNAQDGVFEDD